MELIDFLAIIGVLMIVKGGHVSYAYEDATCEDVALESVSKIIDLCKSIEKGKWFSNGLSLW